MALISSATPSCSNSGRFAGSSDSPMWKRGWRPFSRSVTLWPRRASSAAMVDPPGPPPITRTSHWRAAAGAARAGKLSTVIDRPSLGPFYDAGLRRQSRKRARKASQTPNAERSRNSWRNAGRGGRAHAHDDPVPGDQGATPGHAGFLPDGRLLRAVLQRRRESRPAAGHHADPARQLRGRARGDGGRAVPLGRRLPRAADQAG